MRTELPKSLERVVGLLLPPACREEVLGDLYEKYESPRQYVLTAARVVPSVIVSRIRRTTDVQVLVIETSVLYGAYLASAWYQNPASQEHGLSPARLAIPTAITMSVIMMERAWGPGSKFRNAVSAAITVGVSELFDPIGGFSGLLLVLGLEAAFPYETLKLQSATRPVFSFSGPKFVLKALSGFALISAVLKVAGFSPLVIVTFLALFATGLFRQRSQ